jgi:hypothetical protein
LHASTTDTLTTESLDTAFIIAGDFNPTSNGFKSRFLKIHCNLKQVVKEATRNTSILDLIFTNVNHFYEVPEITVSSIYIWSKNLVAQSEASFVLTAHTKTIERDWN